MRKGNSVWVAPASPTRPQHPLPSPVPTWVQGQQAKDDHQWVHGVYLRDRERQGAARGKGHLTSRNPELAHSCFICCQRKKTREWQEGTFSGSGKNNRIGD